ncbi:unnamed protein product [Lota lota]
MGPGPQGPGQGSVTGGIKIPHNTHGFSRALRRLGPRFTSEGNRGTRAAATEAASRPSNFTSCGQTGSRSQRGQL